MNIESQYIIAQKCIVLASTELEETSNVLAERQVLIKSLNIEYLHTSTPEIKERIKERIKGRIKEAKSKLSNMLIAERKAQEILDRIEASIKLIT